MGIWENSLPLPQKERFSTKRSSAERMERGHCRERTAVCGVAIPCPQPHIPTLAGAQITHTQHTAHTRPTLKPGKAV